MANRPPRVAHRCTYGTRGIHWRWAGRSPPFPHPDESLASLHITLLSRVVVPPLWERCEKHDNAPTVSYGGGVVAGMCLPALGGRGAGHGGGRVAEMRERRLHAPHGDDDEHEGENDQAVEAREVNADTAEPRTDQLPAAE